MQGWQMWFGWRVEVGKARIDQVNQRGVRPRGSIAGIHRTLC